MTETLVFKDSPLGDYLKCTGADVDLIEPPSLNPVGTKNISLEQTNDTSIIHESLMWLKHLCSSMKTDRKVYIDAPSKISWFVEILRGAVYCIPLFASYFLGLSYIIVFGTLFVALWGSWKAIFSIREWWAMRLIQTLIVDLTSSSHMFHLSVRKCLARIQERELLSRGYGFAKPLPPITRLELTTTKLQAVSLRKTVRVMLLDVSKMWNDLLAHNAHEPPDSLTLASLKILWATCSELQDNIIELIVCSVCYSNAEKLWDIWTDVARFYSSCARLSACALSLNAAVEADFVPSTVPLTASHDVDTHPRISIELSNACLMAEELVVGLREVHRLSEDDTSDTLDIAARHAHVGSVLQRLDGLWRRVDTMLHSSLRKTNDVVPQVTVESVQLFNESQVVSDSGATIAYVAEATKLDSISVPDKPIVATGVPPPPPPPPVCPDPSRLEAHRHARLERIKAMKASRPPDRQNLLVELNRVLKRREPDSIIYPIEENH